MSPNGSFVIYLFSLVDLNLAYSVSDDLYMSVTEKEDFFQGEKEETFLSLLNLFFLVKTSATEIIFEYNNQEYAGIIRDVQNTEITISLPGLKESQSRKGSFRFEILNRYYYTEILIISFIPGGLLVRFPREVHFLARRKFSRLEPENLTMRFIILYSPIFEVKALEKNLESRFGTFMAEILSDDPSMRIIYNIFIEEIRKVSRDFEFRMIYKKTPEELSLMETLMKQGQKPFFIHDTSRLEYYIETPARDSLMNYSSYFEELNKTLNKRKALGEMDAIKRDDMRSFLVSFLAIPYFLFADVIGYLYVYTTQFDKFFISPSQAEELYLATELFSYAITKIKIRNSVFNPKAQPTRIVNISTSGLLMEIHDKILFEYLQKHKRIKMQLQIKDRVLEIFGEIVRHYQEGPNYYMGVLIFKSAPDHIQQLEEYLYNYRRQEHLQLAY